MRSALYFKHFSFDVFDDAHRDDPVGLEKQLADVSFNAMVALAAASEAPRPEPSIFYPVAGWFDGWGMVVRPKDMVVKSGERCCQGARVVDNVVLDALNALCLNARQGYIVIDSSVIMTIVNGYDEKFRVSAKVREQTHTIVFPFNANENHWFMVVMRKTLLWGTEVRST
jgi:hypothetical protein